MKTIIETFTTGLLGRFGRLVVRRTKTPDMSALVASLRPVPCGRSLVRLGPDHDGGYLVPDDLEGIVACFSPGVDRECRFEVACADRGMKVFMADRSVPGPPIHHPSFEFLHRFLGPTTDGEHVTPDDWVEGSGVGAGDLLLQMDIEGHEYATLLSASPALLRRFRVIVVEFHWLDQLWNRPWFGLVSQVFGKLLDSHACVHLHPNNCCGIETTAGITVPRLMEFTFLRRDRVSPGGPRPVFPHPLDRDNTEGPTLPLPAVWRPRD